MEAVRRGWVRVPDGAQPAVLVPAEPVTPEPLLPLGGERLPATWQKAVMLVAAVGVLALLALPQIRAAGRVAPTTHVLTDTGRVQSGPLPRVDANRWTQAAPLPVARSRLAAAAAPDRLYVVGGETEDGVTGELLIYDPLTNAWLPASDKPVPVANASAAFLAGALYVPGGTTATGEVTGVLEVYDPVAAEWREASPLPAPRAGYALAVQDGTMYLFGGWDGVGARGEVYAYDPGVDRWTEMTPMPQAAMFLAAAPMGGLIYVAGGFDGSDESADVYAYDPKAEGAGSPWSARADLEQGRGGLAMAAIGQRLYAIGGGWDQGLAYNEQYDARTGAWSRIETPVSGEWRNLGLATLGDRLYALGGWGSGYLAANEQYLALLRQLLPFSSKGD
jgi:hypothetical protein